MTQALLDQFPHFSEFDPGAYGEGSLDPLGLSAVAERMAEQMVPGLRARMSQPRFTTLAVAGAHACQAIRDLTAADGKTKPDIAFEWIIVESFVRHRASSDIRALPGTQKTSRAIKMNRRLGPSTYLSGPRVFGFTGVYRPFALDSDLLTKDGSPGTNADALLGTWEKERSLDGFLGGVPRTPGGKLRRKIEEACVAALQSSEATLAPGGSVMRDLAATMVPSDSGPGERRILRSLILSAVGGEPHEIRAELCDRLLQMPHNDMGQREIATRLLDDGTVSVAARAVLQAASTYEECASAIERSFRRILQDAAARGGTFSQSKASKTVGLEEIAAKLPEQVRRAVNAAGHVQDHLAEDVSRNLQAFEDAAEPAAFIEALLSRHDQVQSDKGKRPWIDPLGKNWIVRTPYRNQSVDLTHTNWIHPMRLTTLANFLEETA
ncbi:hypothetical protein [Gordonia sp. ABSL49_1]|uniref:hypothetical protein n=1 Tax=Gordonia sp. ABSL49_1 TaxID=2920941 RepID=UPI001F0F491C|nr:hypothetical protein [Gordonia sp. ABSL49_1]MCH5642273.1 hypothetical protein [Gordonia sp. ABSL49_1]